MDAPWQRTAGSVGLLAADGTPAQTIFAEMTALAIQTDSINLGQGFPDVDGPAEMIEAAAKSLRSGNNQYGPARGNPDLIEAICEHQHRWYGIGLGASEVLVTAGATEALAATLLAYLSPGDEVVVFEPYYDAYAAVAALVGATLVPVPLFAPDFQPDHGRIERAFTPRTKMVIVNSPHNPTGAIFEADTLELIARLAEKRNAVIVTDEVYEHLTFDAPHRPMALIERARERLVSISSAGKTFSLTGWKVGWITATPQRIREIQTVKQYLSFVSGVPLQPAVAVGLRLPDEHFETLQESYARKRDLLTRGLKQVGFTVYPSCSGYFVLADGTGLGFTDATELARALPGAAGVVGVPVSPFARPSRRDLKPIIRFAFCKQDDVLRDAATRLQALRTVTSSEV